MDMTKLAELFGNKEAEMCITLREDAATPERVDRLIKILNACKFTPTENGAYVSTRQYCRVASSIIWEDEDLFDSLGMWLYYEPDTGYASDRLKNFLEAFDKQTFNE